MSSNNSPKTPQTPEPSKFVQKVNSMKLSAMSDEKKAAVIGRIKITAAFAAGVLTTAATVAAASYYASFNNAEAQVDESEETTED
jgi:hypothetical protein